MFHLKLLEELRARGVEPASLRYQLRHTRTPITAKRAGALLRGQAEPTLSEYAAMLNFADRVLPEWNAMPVAMLHLSPKLGFMPRTPDLKSVPSGRDVMLAIAHARETLLRSMPSVNLTGPVGAESASTLLGTKARELWDAARARGNDPHKALSEFCVRVSMEVARRVYDAAPESNPQVDWVHVVQTYCREVPNALMTRYDTLARFAPTPVEPLKAIQILERFATHQLEITPEPA